METQLYRHFNAANELLYVGISLSTVVRLSQHKEGSKWYSDIAKVVIENFESRQAALDAEKIAVQSENPKHNVQLKKKLKELNKEIRRSPDFILEEKAKVVRRHVEYDLTYRLDRIFDKLNMKKTEIDKHIANGNLRWFTVEGSYSSNLKGPKPQKMITGWALIDFIEYLESQGQ